MKTDETRRQTSRQWIAANRPQGTYLRHRSRGYAGAYNWPDILAAGDEPTMVVLIPLGATGCTWRGTELVFSYPEPEPA